jgi:hypothetical protein
MLAAGWHWQSQWHTKNRDIKWDRRSEQCATGSASVNVGRRYQRFGYRMPVICRVPVAPGDDFIVFKSVNYCFFTRL